MRKKYIRLLYVFLLPFDPNSVYKLFVITGNTMRIVSLETFVKLPNGILFAKYEPVNFGELQIKRGIEPDGDCVVQSLYDMDAPSDTDYYINMLNYQQSGTSFPLSFNSVYPNEQYEPDQLFAILERSDYEGLIKLLTSSLVTAAYR